jgi:hypothetical protein
MSILDEHASFQVPSRVLFNDSLVSKSLEHITDEDRASLASLYGKDLSTKLYMNGHRMMIDQTGEGQPLMLDRFNNMLGIYLLCARLNHSCRPNAVRAVGENIMSVVSQTDIRAGEEITISYLDDNFLVAEERSKQLRSKVPRDDIITCAQGCGCVLCTSSDIAAKRLSDNRRMELAAFRYQMLRSIAVGPTTMMKFLALMQKEGLILPTMGPKCMLKFATSLSGSTSMSRSAPAAAPHVDRLHEMAFVPGTLVRLYSLQARPELNGCTGVVMKAFDPKTGRVGVMLDPAADIAAAELQMEKVIIAAKPANLLLLTRPGG